MSFRQSYPVLTETPGGYVSGLFTSGVRALSTVLASIQPVTGEDMITAPEGRRIQDMVKIYTATPLTQAVEATGQQPDIVVWQGYGYEVTSIDVWQSGVIPHYKIIATRRMAVPDVNMWAAGTLNRG